MEVCYKHVFRNSLMPISVLLLLRLPMLIEDLSNEQVLGYAGAIPVCWQPLMEATTNWYCTILLLSTVSLASVLIDMFTALLDPRVRLVEILRCKVIWQQYCIKTKLKNPALQKKPAKLLNNKLAVFGLIVVKL